MTPSRTAVQANGLAVTSLRRLEPGLSREDEQGGSQDKWVAVQRVLGDDASRVVVKQLGGSLGGKTSVRNALPLTGKESGYFQRARDLGQVFTAEKDFTLDAIILRTGMESARLRQFSRRLSVRADVLAMGKG